MFARINEKAMKGRAGSGRARRRAASRARTVATHARASDARGRRLSWWAIAVNVAKKTKSETPRLNPRGRPKVGNYRRK